MRLKKVLVTGSTGFVGRHILMELNRLPIEIVIVARNIQPNDLKNIKVKEVILSKDIFLESKDWWNQKLQGIDLVIHLAWFAEPGKYLHSEYNMNCYKGTVRLAEASAMSGVKRFIGIGTCFEYEFSNQPVNQFSKLAPLSLYASSKVDTFLDLTKIFESYKIEFLWCRLFYLYGEGEHPDRLFPYLERNISQGQKVRINGKNKVKDYINVKDASRIIVQKSFSNQIGPFNVCSGTGSSLKEIAESIQQKYHKNNLVDYSTAQKNKFDPDFMVGLNID